MSVETVPGGPHFTILPLTASAISEAVQVGLGVFGKLGFIELRVTEMECLDFMIEFVNK